MWQILLCTLKIPPTKQFNTITLYRTVQHDGQQKEHDFFTFDGVITSNLHRMLHFKFLFLHCALPCLGKILEGGNFGEFG